MLRRVRIANIVVSGLFLFAVAVQYNDPDPVRWMAIYSAGFLTCVLWEARKLPRAIAIAVVATTLCWGGWIVWGIHLTAPFGEALTDWHMHAGGSEELRESLGLFLVAAWCAVLAWKPLRAVRGA
jgi:hypothetical protein